MYLLFQGNKYYPMGGAHDLAGTYLTKGEAVAAGEAFLKKEECLAWAHVFDLASGEIIWKDEV